MSGYESPSPEDEVDTNVVDGGDATGGGSPGDQDAMGSDEELTVEEGSGRNVPEGEVSPGTTAGNFGGGVTEGGADPDGQLHTREEQSR